MATWKAEFVRKFRELTYQLSLPVGAGTEDGFAHEFKVLTCYDDELKLNASEFVTAKSPENDQKNRYPDVMANESTRCRVVGLEPGASDYINMNYVTAGSKCYISGQAPLPLTMAAFWNVVWYYGSRTVVMLCSEVENGRAKCDRYWPARIGGHCRYGEFDVALTNEEIRQDVVLRTFTVCNTVNNDTRTVWHYHFTGWPDFGVPNNVAALLDIMRSVDEVNDVPHGEDATRPIVCHCSAGIGRTGTFIALHAALSKFMQDTEFNVYEIVRSLKEQRSGMVQRPEQYRFIFYTLLGEMERIAGKQFPVQTHPTKGLPYPVRRTPQTYTATTPAPQYASPRQAYTLPSPPPGLQQQQFPQPTPQPLRPQAPHVPVAPMPLQQQVPPPVAAYAPRPLHPQPQAPPMQQQMAHTYAPAPMPKPYGHPSFQPQPQNGMRPPVHQDPQMQLYGGSRARPPVMARR